MLIALLNAKSAEDQRLAQLATLHQTVLQMQHALAIAAVTAQQQPPARAAPPPSAAPRKKRSHAEYGSDAYKLHPYEDREPPLPPSPDSSASGSSPRSDLHLSNPGTMSIRTLLHPSKRRRESAPYEDHGRAYDERDKDRDRAYAEDREYRSARARPHVVVHPPPEREYRQGHPMRTSSARDEAVEPPRSP